MNDEPLDNIVWHCLTGMHAQFASGTGTIRRFARGFSPIVGFADFAHPDLAALAPYCDAGEHFYCIAWPGAIGSGWALTADAPGLQLVWDAPAPAADDAFAAVRLQASDVPAMQALVALTQPGPFAERTIELGEYYGVFVDGELVAMAGERMGVGTFREISGVCTRPGFQGRGLARRLVEKLVRLQLARGQTPFLHVMADNHNAHRLYQRMGFRLRARMMLRVIERAA